jgi:hypothetical protein
MGTDRDLLHEGGFPKPGTAYSPHAEPVPFRFEEPVNLGGTYGKQLLFDFGGGHRGAFPCGYIFNEAPRLLVQEYELC